MNGTELRAAIQRQRVKHIVSSYHLDGAEIDGSETERFHCRLEQLLNHHPTPLVELALVEVLVDSWIHVPPLRGLAFLAQTQRLLEQWKDQSIVSTLTPQQFQQITNLDPIPVFGMGDRPSASLKSSP